MIQEFIDKWHKYKEDLRNVISYKMKEGIWFEYEDFVKLIVTEILNKNLEFEYLEYDKNKITIVNDGDYQGTQLFLIPKKVHQPTVYDYVILDNNYGSCSGCDTLKAINENAENSFNFEVCLKDYMKLCLDMIEGMKKIE